MVILDGEFVNRLKIDTAQCVVDLFEAVRSDLGPGNEWTESDYHMMLEVYSFLEAAAEAEVITGAISVPQVNDYSERTEVCMAAFGWLRDLSDYYSFILSQNRVENSKMHFRSMFGTIFTYEFSQGDIERVQVLINELRVQISSVELEDGHKQRLLKRLEKLQSELHKKISDLDRFWGLVGDAGVVIGKLGADAKPIVERIKEVADIVWRTQSRAEELPSGSGFPQLQDQWED